MRLMTHESFGVIAEELCFRCSSPIDNYVLYIFNLKWKFGLDLLLEFVTK